MREGRPGVASGQGVRIVSPDSRPHSTALSWAAVTLKPLVLLTAPYRHHEMSSGPATGPWEQGLCKGLSQAVTPTPGGSGVGVGWGWGSGSGE